MSVMCPCGQDIPIADINVAEGVALCRGCGKLSRLMDLATPVEEAAAVEAAGTTPPNGCRIEDRGTEVTLSASTRSLAAGGFFLVFAVFWNSLVSVFLVGLIGGFWAHFIGPVPTWFPAQSQSGQGAGSSATLGGLLFMCLFLTPFVLVGFGVAIAALLGLFGHQKIRLRGGDGVLFTGVGPFGWRRQFDASRVKVVKFVDSSYEKNGKRDRLISVEGEETTLKFGSMLTDQRRLWLGGALKAVLTPRAGSPARRT